MHRFFVRPSDIFDNIVQLGVDDARHIRSLRLRPSEFFIVCDGEGFDYKCKLGEKSDGSTDEFGMQNAECGMKNSIASNSHTSQKNSALESCHAEIFDKYPSQGEPAVKCSVFIAYSKGDRLDYAVQKSVELGAYEIALFPAARCVSIPSDTQKKIARLQKISLETAKQSGRGRVPVVFSVKSFDEAISKAGHADLPLFFYELEKDSSLKTRLEQATTKQAPAEQTTVITERTAAAREQTAQKTEQTTTTGEQAVSKMEQTTIKRERTTAEQASADTANGNPATIGTISIVTGPEGGFEQHEADTAKSAGLKPTSLGSRILRSETAPIAALSAIMFYLGEI